MAQPLVGIHLMSLADGKEGIDHGRMPGAFMGTCRHVVFASEGHGPDCVFDQIVVDFQQSVIQIAAQGLPPGGAVGKSLSDLAPGQNLFHFCMDPFAQPVNDGQGFPKTKFLTLVRSEVLLPGGPINGIKALNIAQCGSGPLPVVVQVLFELPAGMRPAGQVRDSLTSTDLLINAISIRLQIPFKSIQYSPGPRCSTLGLVIE
jgi:hypothetical protein